MPHVRLRCNLLHLLCVYTFSCLSYKFIIAILDLHQSCSAGKRSGCGYTVCTVLKVVCLCVKCIYMFNITNICRQRCRYVYPRCFCWTSGIEVCTGHFFQPRPASYGPGPAHVIPEKLSKTSPTRQAEDWPSLPCLQPALNTISLPGVVLEESGEMPETETYQKNSSIIYSHCKVQISDH